MFYIFILSGRIFKFLWTQLKKLVCRRRNEYFTLGILHIFAIFNSSQIDKNLSSKYTRNETETT